MVSSHLPPFPQVYEHDLASMGAAGEADCSPDEAWEFLAPRLLPSGDWDRTSPDPLRQRVDSDIMELVRAAGSLACSR